MRTSSLIERLRAPDSWARWLLLGLAAAACLGAAWWFKAPCRDLGAWNGKSEYGTYCYNEFIPLYGARGFDRQLRPYVDAPFEYPVLSGEAAWLASRGGGGAVGFYDRLALLLAIAALLCVVAVASLLETPTWRVFAYALAPPTVLYLFQNFDQLAVAPALLGLVALRRKRIGWAGVAFGIGAAVKLFPAVVAFGAALTLADGARRWRPGARLLVYTVLTFFAINLPAAAASFSGWRATWSFHADRLADWGSIFYWISQHTGWSLVSATRAGDWADLALFIGLIAALVTVCVKHRVATETAAAAALAAFLLGNKVWSPQYALWLLPFLVLLDLHIGWLLAFSAIELGELVGKFEWFAGAGGVNVVNGWTHLFEAMIWLRWAFTAAFVLWLLVRRPGVAVAGATYAAPPLAPRAPESDAPPILAWRHRRWGGLLLAAVALLYLARLESAANPSYVHDECYQAFTAHRYVEGDPNAWNPRATRDDALRFATDDMTVSTTYEWVHPPAAKWVMAFWIRLLGFRPLAWRLGSVLFGLLLLASVWRLGARMHGEGFGALALLLAACDGLTLVMSRVAMNDIYAVACAFVASGLLYRYWTESQRRRGWLLGAGALFGLGLAMKWSVLPLFGECALLAGARVIWDSLRPGARGRDRLLDAGAWLAAFVLLPFAIYLAAYVPYFARGHSFSDLVDLFHQMRWYHSHLSAQHGYGSRWWSWPLVARPVWFYASRAMDGRRAVIYAMGNPILWWSFLPCLFYVAIRFARARLAKDGLILVGFFGSWLPWMFVQRVGFLQYLLPAVPFGVLAVATTLRDLARRRWGAWLAGAAVAACVGAFVFFYPIWSAWPVTSESLAGHHWIWFDRWR